MDQEPCTHCNGTGVVRVKYATESDEEEFFCPVCSGAGVPLSHYSTDSVKLKKYKVPKYRRYRWDRWDSFITVCSI